MTDTPGTMEERARAIYAQFIIDNTPGAGPDDVPQFDDNAHGVRIALAALTEAADEIASLRARVEAMREALVDLMSWFPEKPSDPEWRIKGGKFGADDAVEHARSLVEKEPAT